MMCLHDRYRIYVCPECGEQSQYAGFCDFCHARLAAYSCVPVERIIDARDLFVENSSPIPGEFVNRFVEHLLTSS
jgi:methionyl-tRNA synthetase